MTYIITGPPRLRVLTGLGGTTVKTLLLPPPSKGGLKLHMEPQVFKEELIDKSKRTRKLGYSPILTLSWSPYPEALRGYTSGNANGQMPSWEQLLEIISAPSGFLVISPGPDPEGGFVVDEATPSEVSIVGLQGLANGAKITFTARDVLATAVLGTF